MLMIMVLRHVGRLSEVIVCVRGGPLIIILTVVIRIIRLRHRCRLLVYTCHTLVGVLRVHVLLLVRLRLRPTVIVHLRRGILLLLSELLAVLPVLMLIARVIVLLLSGGVVGTGSTVLAREHLLVWHCDVHVC